MPSLRQKVTTYFRQLSFINEPREGSRTNLNSHKIDSDGNFMTKYLDGRKDERTYISPGPDVISSQELNLLPELPIAPYPTGPNTINAACTGPDEGLTGIKRSKLHLSAGSDIDFIDTNQEQDLEIRKSISNHNKFKLQNSQKYRSDQNANKTTSTSSTTPTNTNTNVLSRSRKNSRSGLINSSGVSSTGDKQQKLLQTSTITTAVQINSNSSDEIDENNKQNINDNNPKNIDDSNNSTTPPTTIIVSMISTKNSPQTQLKYKTKSKNPLKNNNVNNQIKAKTDLIDSTVAATANTLLQQTIEKNNSVVVEKENTTPYINETMELNKQDKLLTDSIVNENENNLTNIGSDDSGVGGVVSYIGDSEPVASVTNWKMESDHAYGISISLYEYNMLTKESMGNPIADCYGLVTRGNVAALAMADGVNWGDGARLAARSAINGSLDYLDTAIFGLSQECAATTTRDVFVSLLRSLWEGHDCILEVGGALSTLTVAVVLPLSGQYQGKYVVCACNVGDSLGYVYSKKYGIREFTQGSHDITSMRDMRDALGALGPVDGNKPELSNLTLSMTIVETGDIVFLTSDGISDNFDPVVGKFAEAWTPDTKVRTEQEQLNPLKPQLAPKRQNKSATTLYSNVNNKNDTTKSLNQNELHSASGSTTRQPKTLNQTTLNSTPASTSSMPMRPPRSKQSPVSSVGQLPRQQSCEKTSSLTNIPTRPKYMRSHTVIEPRVSGTTRHQQQQPQRCNYPRSAAGLPLVTGPQRHTLTLLRIEDLLSYGINGQLCPCPSSRKLCHLLVDFVRMITSARRKTLEQRELFYKVVTGSDGVKREVEMNRLQHRSARKRVVDTNAFSALPGKLDHASVVAYTVGSGLQPKEFQETNF